MANALKFGPEWLRNLSGGNGGGTSPGSAPSIGSSGPLGGGGCGGAVPLKLANYRYGHEEMLALYTGDYTLPPELQELDFLFTSKPMPPLALSNTEEDEDSHMYNSGYGSHGSLGGLRSLGHTGPIRGTRGGLADRGRGRGRGRGMDGSYYGRAFDEDGVFRKPGREPWDEGRDKRFPSTIGRGSYDGEGTFMPYQQGRKDFGRSMSGENWRTGDSGEHYNRKPDHHGDGIHYKKSMDEEETEDWRRNGAPPHGPSTRWNARGSRGSGSSNWRDPKQRAEVERTAHYEDYRPSSYNRDRTYSRSKSDEPEPEWATEDDGMVGTFDSSGAFMSMKDPGGMNGDSHPDGGRPRVKRPSGSKSLEKMPANAEEYRKASEESQNNQKRPNSIHGSLQSEQRSPPTSMRTSPRAGSEPPLQPMKGGDVPRLPPTADPPSSNGHHHQQHPVSQSVITNNNNSKVVMMSSSSDGGDDPRSVETSGSQPKHTAVHGFNNAAAPPPVPPYPRSSEAPSGESTDVQSGGVTTANSSGAKEPDEFEYLEKAAENLVAKWTAEEEAKTEAPLPPKQPPQDENAFKWFYKDPQGAVQGPFQSKEMLDWFTAGYFTNNLLVKRGCDEAFQQLGDLSNKIGKLPFLLPEEQIASSSIKAEPAAIPQQHPQPSMRGGVTLANPALQPQTGGPHLLTEIMSGTGGQPQSLAQIPHQPTNTVNPLLAGLGIGSKPTAAGGILGSGVGGGAGLLKYPSGIPTGHVNSMPVGNDLTPSPLASLPSLPTDPIKLLHEQQLQQQYLVQHSRVLQALSQKEGFQKMDRETQQKMIASLLTNHQQQQQQALIQAQQKILQQQQQQIQVSNLTPEQQIQHLELQKVATFQQQQQQQQSQQQQPQVSLPNSQGGALTPQCTPVNTPTTFLHHPDFNRPPAPQENNPTSEGDSIWGNLQQRSGVAPTVAAAVPPASTSVWNKEAEPASNVWNLLSGVQKQSNANGPTAVMSEGDQAATLRQQEAKRMAEQQHKEALEQLEQQREEMARQQEEEQRRLLEQQQLQEEERRRQEEMKQLAEKKRQEEEEQQRRQLEEMQRKQQAEERKKEQKRKEELEREEKRKQAEARKKEAERLRKEQEAEERLRQEQLEKERREEMERQQEYEAAMERARQEEIKKKELAKQQQQASKQLQNMKLPSTANWANKQEGGKRKAKQGKEPKLTLEEIQMQQKLVEQKQQELAAEQAAKEAAAQAAAMNTTWASKSRSGLNNHSKSLHEIQTEQAKEQQSKQQQLKEQKAKEQKAKEQKAKEQKAQKQKSKQQQQQSNQNATKSHWAAGTPWSSGQSKTPVGFWEVPPTSEQQTRKSGKKQQNSSAFPSLPPGSKPAKAKTPKKTGDSGARTIEKNAVQRLFQESRKPTDDFAVWCEQTLTSMKTSVDIPTFIAFLSEVESAYEVVDYAKAYLGETKEATQFAQQFLERREKRKKENETDGGWGTVIGKTTRKQHQQHHIEKQQQQQQSSKKGGKKKGKKVDASNLLTYTVHAGSDRVNMGEIESIE